MKKWNNSILRNTSNISATSRLLLYVIYLSARLFLNVRLVRDVVHIGESDCPAFEGLYSFAQISCGGSIDAAVMLNNGNADICINWAGKLLH